MHFNKVIQRFFFHIRMCNTYNKTEGKYVRGEVDTSACVGLRATPHWMAQSSSTDI
jgi:hypothetical protein